MNIADAALPVAMALLTFCVVYLAGNFMLRRSGTKVPRIVSGWRVGGCVIFRCKRDGVVFKFQGDRNEGY